MAEPPSSVQSAMSLAPPTLLQCCRRGWALAREACAWPQMSSSHRCCRWAPAGVPAAVHSRACSRARLSGHARLDLAPQSCSHFLSCAPAALVVQVPLGSVTPLAACQPGAAGVALLLDAKLQGQARIFVHPLDNTATCVLSPAGLEAYLRCAVCGAARASACRELNSCMARQNCMLSPNAAEDALGGDGRR